MYDRDVTPSGSGPNGHVLIVSAARTPIGKFGGALSTIVATLLYELRRREGHYGLATLCLGGGGSVAAAFERV
jgi:acetyl-CoA acetyltransferase